MQCDLGILWTSVYRAGEISQASVPDVPIMILIYLPYYIQVEESVDFDIGRHKLTAVLLDSDDEVVEEGDSDDGDEEEEEENAGTGVGAMLTETSRKQFYKAYKSMMKPLKWKLKSGRYVEDVLYSYGASCEHEE